jgi:adenylate cyclase
MVPTSTSAKLEREEIAVTEEPRSAAIIFCDICDFASIVEEDEARARAIAARAGACIEQAAEGHGGQIIEQPGDGVLVEFSRATSALQAAIDVQKAVAKHNAEVEPHEQFQLRIEVHAGDVIVGNGEVLCNGIDVTSRMEPLAAPGGIRLSRGVLDIIHKRISGG